MQSNKISYLVGQVSELAVLVAMLQPQDLEGVGDDEPLHLVIWLGDALERLEALQSCCPALGLVGNHPTPGERAMCQCSPESRQMCELW